MNRPDTVSTTSGAPLPIVDPLAAPSPPEVPLANAPLIRVIAQVRFPEILSIERRDFVAPFQNAIRSSYPVLRQEQTHGIVISQGGATPARPQIAWRFSDAAGHWRVSLTPTFMALETTKYLSRADFFTRLKSLALALEEHINPRQVDRLGVRYVDRIAGTALSDIAHLVRAEVLGIIGTGASKHLIHAVSESLFSIGDNRVRTRWGSLSEGETVDPAAIEPIDQKSWVLDLDMFSTTAMPFVVPDVVAAAEGYATRIYTIFRWAVTEEFLSRYGGKP